MGDFKRYDRGGGRDYDRRSSGGRDFSNREMHKVTCAKCGRDCEVPFRPNSDRPVYCSDCFKQKRDGDGDSRGSNRNFQRPNFDERRPFSGGQNNNNGQLIDQLKFINNKLDRLISILEPKTAKLQSSNKEENIFIEPTITESKVPKKSKVLKKDKKTKTLPKSGVLVDSTVEA